MTVMTLQKILTALYEGFVRFGCGIGGLAYPEDYEIPRTTRK
jgi:hypothetical protein